MPPENYFNYITTFTISLDEFKDIFPWFEDLTDEMPVEKPKSKRGRKPKAHRAPQNEIKMEQA
jgi:hypothetical protein